MSVTCSRESELRILKSLVVQKVISPHLFRDQVRTIRCEYDGNEKNKTIAATG